MEWQEARNVGGAGHVDSALQRDQSQKSVSFEALAMPHELTPSGAEPNTIASSSSASVGHSSANDYRERLLVLLAKYAPSKTQKIDTYLEKYKGREEALLVALQEKYGATISSISEGSGSGVPAVAAAAPSARERLMAIYQVHAPHKLVAVDHLLQKYAGREEEVIRAAMKKYEEAPSTADPSDITYNFDATTVVEADTPSPATEVLSDRVSKAFGKTPPAPRSHTVNDAFFTFHTHQGVPQDHKVEEEAIDNTEQEAAEEASMKTEQDAAVAKAAEEASMKAERDAAVAKAAEEASMKAERDAAVAKAAEEASMKAERDAAVAKAAEEASMKAERDAAVAKAAEEASMKAERDAAVAKAAEEAQKRSELEKNAQTGGIRNVDVPVARSARVSPSPTGLVPVPTTTVTTPLADVCRPMVHELFALLGTSTTTGELLADAAVQHLILSKALGRPPQTNGTFTSGEESLLHMLSEELGASAKAAGWTACADRMKDFAAECTRFLLPSRVSSRSISSLQLGFSVRRCVLPTVIPRWQRCWAVLRGDDCLELCKPNSTVVEFYIHFESIVRCMRQATSAPSQFARAGVMLLLSDGPAAVGVFVCTEVPTHAEALVRAYRKWQGRATGGAVVARSNVQQPQGPQQRQDGQTSLHSLTHSDQRDEAALSVERCRVWCYRAALNTYSVETWSFSCGALLSSADGHDQHIPLDKVVEVLCTSQLPLYPPNRHYGQFGFILRYADGTMNFYCAESLKKRSFIVGQLRRCKLRLSLLGNAM